MHCACWASSATSALMLTRRQTRPCAHAQALLAILGVCACAAAAVWLFRHQWRRNKDAALLRHTLERESQHGAVDDQPMVANGVYRTPSDPPNLAASGALVMCKTMLAWCGQRVMGQ